MSRRAARAARRLQPEMLVERASAGQFGARLPPLPIYHRISRAVQNRIYHGVYRPGEPIPSESELGREFGVTRLTVRQALAELRAQGLLVTRPGAGSYVAHGSAPVKPVNFIGYLEDVILQAAGMENTVVRIEEIEPSVLVRDRLRLRSTARVLLIERTRASKGEPLFHAFNYVPARFGRRLDPRDLPTRSLTELLPASCGIAVTGAAQSFTATGAPPDVASYLGLEPGAPTLYTEIVMYSGRLPIVLSVAYYRPDRALFTAHLTTLANGNAATAEAERAS